jgi:hypothetical protein
VSLLTNLKRGEVEGMEWKYDLTLNWEEKYIQSLVVSNLTVIMGLRKHIHDERSRV